MTVLDSGFGSGIVQSKGRARATWQNMAEEGKDAGAGFRLELWAWRAAFLVAFYILVF